MSKPQLKPTKLIPALVRYSQRRQAAMVLRPSRHSSSQPLAAGAAGDDPSRGGAVGEGEDLAIKYLEFCVNELKLKVCVCVCKRVGACCNFDTGRANSWPGVS